MCVYARVACMILGGQQQERTSLNQAQDKVPHNNIKMKYLELVICNVDLTTVNTKTLLCKQYGAGHSFPSLPKSTVMFRFGEAFKKTTS